MAVSFGGVSLGLRLTGQTAPRIVRQGLGAGNGVFRCACPGVGQLFRNAEQLQKLFARNLKNSPRKRAKSSDDNDAKQ